MAKEGSSFIATDCYARHSSRLLWSWEAWLLLELRGECRLLLEVYLLLLLLGLLEVCLLLLLRLTLLLL